ncbi:MAG: hypothetical protein AAFN12_17060 [Cyanobacteria bacterium J06560_2]
MKRKIDLLQANEGHLNLQSYKEERVHIDEVPKQTIQLLSH